jgi:hypothetical protein
MGYSGALVTVSHTLSHDTTATTAPRISAMPLGTTTHAQPSGKVQQHGLYIQCKLTENFRPQ